MKNGLTRSPSIPFVPAFNQSRVSKQSPATPAQTVSSFIEIDCSQMDVLKTTHFEYLDEYQANYVEGNKVQFLLDNCDPLPLHYVDDCIKFFFSSAQYGNHRPGSPIEVLNHEIQRTYIVRGQNRSHEFQIYIGITDQPSSENTERKIYSAHILFAQIKNLRCPKDLRTHYFVGATSLENLTIAQATHPYLSHNKSLFDQDKLRPEIISQLFQVQKGAYFDGEKLRMKTCYWTSRGNVLKKTQYTRNYRKP